jgi:hypothetical protein
MISVSANNIKRGVRQHAVCCPVALALEQKYPGTTIRVDDKGIHIDGVDYRMIPRVRKILAAYDSGFPMKPFSFRLMEV